MAADYTVAPDLQHLGYIGGIFLGRGGEGCVYRFKYCGRQDRGCVRPGQLVAIKITPGPKIRPNEVLVQSRIDHSGIVKVLDVARYVDHRLGACLVTVLELANPTPVLGPGTSLASCIKPIVDANMRNCVFSGPTTTAAPVIPLWAVTRPQMLFPDNGGAAPATIKHAEPDLRWVIAQVAVALDFLHQHPLQVCHRDVKAENVLVTVFTEHADGVPRPEVKIADFGFSRAMRGNGDTPSPPAASLQNLARTRLGTAWYLAPEIYALRPEDGYCGMKADVWSLGVLVCVLVTGVRPFHHHSTDEGRDIMRRSRNPQHVARVIDNIARAGGSAALCALLRQMLSVDPATRCTMHEVLHSPWMACLNGDVRSPHSPPADSGQPPQFLPVWDALTASQRERACAAHAAYNAHTAAHGPAVGGPPTPSGCARCGWTLPHLPPATVKAMLDNIRREGHPREG